MRLPFCFPASVLLSLTSAGSGLLSADWSIEVLLQRWDLDCILVPLDQFHADQPELAGSSLPGRHTIQMMIISKKNG